MEDHIDRIYENLKNSDDEAISSYALMMQTYSKDRKKYEKYFGLSYRIKSKILFGLYTVFSKLSGMMMFRILKLTKKKVDEFFSKVE